MNFTDVIIKRRSIRRFTSNPIPDVVLKRILEAGRLAPTWANMQGVRYIVVQDPERIKSVAEATFHNQFWLLGVSGAPMLIVVCISPKDSGKNPSNLEYFTVDAAICMEHIILAATNEGLGTCWIGWFDESKIKEILAIPEETRIVGLTPIGYPDPNKTPKPQQRKPLNEIMFKEQYGNSL